MWTTRAPVRPLVATERQEWWEDPEEPGFLKPPGEPVALGPGDTMSITHTVIDGIALPWADVEVQRAE